MPVHKETWGTGNFSKRGDEPSGRSKVEKRPWATPVCSPGLDQGGLLGPNCAEELVPPPLTWTGVGRSQRPPGSLPSRRGEFWEGARGTSPYLSASPAVRSWGLCGWGAFSPGRSAAWCPLERRSDAGGERGPDCSVGGARGQRGRQVREGSGSLA